MQDSMLTVHSYIWMGFEDLVQKLQEQGFKFIDIHNKASVKGEYGYSCLQNGDVIVRMDFEDYGKRKNKISVNGYILWESYQGPINKRYILNMIKKILKERRKK